MLFTTVYTPEYASIVQTLLLSVARHGVGIFADAVPSLSSWRANVLLKLDHLLRVFDYFPDEDLVFLDADAEIVGRPTDAIEALMREQAFDVAMAWYPLDGYGVHRDGVGWGRWHAGTIVMPARGRRASIVGAAKGIIAREGPADRAPEEHAICEAILRMPARCVDLSRSLCHIFDRPNEHGETFIVQHQASRRMVDVVGR